MARQPTGTEIIAAMAKGAVWGTPVVLGAGDGIWLLDESVESAPDTLMDESAGNAFLECTDLGNIVSEGDLNALLKYENLLLPFALCLGIAGVPATLTDGYEHILKCADNIEGLFACFAIDKIQKVHENPSLKIAGFTITGEAGDYLRVTFNVIANTLDTESTTNTTATMANVTFVIRCGNIVFNNGLFLLKDQGGAAPTDPTDRIQPSGFELAFNRNVTGDFVANGTREIIEPQQDGQPEITLAVTFPRYTDTRFLQDLFSKQEHELIASWTGDLIVPPAGTDSYKFYMEFPKLVLTDSAVPLAGLGKMPFTANYRVLKTDAIPTGFDNANPVTLGFINSITTDPLA
jgi:hypothetical protein